ncbi:MAG TPA: ferritin-like domain-containing protein [Gallionellaceae bacterium]
MAELRTEALRWLAVCEPADKVAGVLALAESWQRGELTLDHSAALTATQTIPGYPERPELVPPSAVPQRGVATVAGRAATIHALAHIEFVAINLALDAVWRFAHLPLDYYADWLRVASEEAHHYSMLAGHLQTLGYAYGDFKAHNGLWEMAARTEGDVLLRMALLPRTLEARGLDVTPPMRAKLAQAGDLPAAEILDVILADEIGHVLIGNRWFNWLCAQRGLEPESTYVELATRLGALPLRGQINREARLAAGFSERELAALSRAPGK